MIARPNESTVTEVLRMSRQNKRKFDRSRRLDWKIMTKNLRQAEALREALVEVIMQNGRLSAEIASRWARKNGYVFADAAEADAEAARIIRVHAKRSDVRGSKKAKARRVSAEAGKKVANT